MTDRTREHASRIADAVWAKGPELTDAVIDALDRRRRRQPTLPERRFKDSEVLPYVRDDHAPYDIDKVARPWKTVPGGHIARVRDGRGGAKWAAKIDPGGGRDNRSVSWNAWPGRGTPVGAVLPPDKNRTHTERITEALRKADRALLDDGWTLQLYVPPDWTVLPDGSIARMGGIQGRAPLASVFLLPTTPQERVKAGWVVKAHEIEFRGEFTAPHGGSVNEARGEAKAAADTLLAALGWDTGR